jgi:hypothetical protein
MAQAKCLYTPKVLLLLILIVFCFLDFGLFGALRRYVTNVI